MKPHRPRYTLATTLFILLATASGVLSQTPQPQQGPLPSPSLTKALHQAESLLDENPKLREQGYKSSAEVLAKHEYERQRGILFPKLVRGNPTHREVALTFDDGPYPQYTEKVLDILRREEVVATFFLVGKRVDEHPELVRMEVADGHEIANHTYHHLRLSSIPSHLIAPELQGGAQAIMRAVGSSTRLFRPPGGEYDDEVIREVKRLGYVMVLWTDDPGDFANPGATVIEKRTLRDIENGAIILLHSGVQQTIDILPDLIHHLKRQGYTFVTCSAMALERGAIDYGGPRVDPSPSPSPQRHSH